MCKFKMEDINMKKIVSNILLFVLYSWAIVFTIGSLVMIGEDFFGTIFFGIISLAFWIPALKKTPRKTPEEKQ